MQDDKKVSLACCFSRLSWNRRDRDGDELTYLLGAWGSDDPVADVNDDGIVDGADLTDILANWDQCP